MLRLSAKVFATALACAGVVAGETLGFVEQKFSDLHFDHGKWARSTQLPCYLYTAQVDGATVNVLRVGMGNFVPFKAKKGLTVSVCGSLAAFEEGFEAGLPGGVKAPEQPSL